MKTVNCLLNKERKNIDFGHVDVSIHYLFISNLNLHKHY